MNDKDIETLSTCDGMLDILEDAVENTQSMPTSLHEAIVKASNLRKSGYQKISDSLDKDEIPGWMCQDCGEPIGYLGRFLQVILWKLHKCNKDNLAKNLAVWTKL
jgi:hypothetical protein